jgi:hypothetical protein
LEALNFSRLIKSNDRVTELEQSGAINSIENEIRNEKLEFSSFYVRSAYFFASRKGYFV